MQAGVTERGQLAMRLLRVGVTQLMTRAVGSV